MLLLEGRADLLLEGAAPADLQAGDHDLVGLALGDSRQAEQRGGGDAEAGYGSALEEAAA